MTPETAAAYETGHGSVVLRATAHVEYEGSKRKKKRANLTGSAAAAAEADADAEAAAAAAAAGGKALIVFTEMPYQVCKVGGWVLPMHVLLQLLWCAGRMAWVVDKHHNQLWAQPAYLSRLSARRVAHLQP